MNLTRKQLTQAFPAANAQDWKPFGGIKSNPGLWSWQGNGTRTMEQAPSGDIRVTYSHGHASNSFASSGMVIFSKDKTPKALKNDDVRNLPISIIYPE